MRLAFLSLYLQKIVCEVV